MLRKGMTLDVYSYIPDIPGIPTNPVINIIIQIRSILWFGKHMTLGVCMSLLIFSTFPTFQKLFNHVGFKSAAKCRLVDVANVSELHTKLELYRQSYIFGLQPLKNLVETTGTF